MTQVAFRWLFAVVALVALAWIILTLPAGAEWPQDAFNCRAYRADLYWQSWARRHCPDWRWRQWRRWHQSRVLENPLCHDLISATGSQAESEESAYERAVVAWQGRVRFLYGERYLEPAAARDARIICSPSNVMDTVRDKTLSALYRCELTARPCRRLPQKLELGGK